MSHHTSFEMSFTNKRLLYRAMRNLNWEPETRVWLQYKNEFTKSISIGGSVIGKLLTGTVNGINIFFTETENGFHANFESSQLSPEQLESQGWELLSILKSNYVHVAVEQLAADLRDKGITISMEMTEHDDYTAYVLSIDNTDRTLHISVDTMGNVEEKIEGVVGRSCADLTQSLETMLGMSTQTAQRTWTHEYDSVIEDQVIQVLRLN